MLRVDDPLLLSKPGHNVAHLWVLITGPDPQTGEVLIVNLTTKRPHSDITVVLQAGDHPFVDHATVVNYSDARLAKAEVLESYTRLGTYLRQPALSPAVLQRIQDGLFKSPFTPNKIKTYFRARTT